MIMLAYYYNPVSNEDVQVAQIEHTEIIQRANIIYYNKDFNSQAMPGFQEFLNIVLQRCIVSR